MKKIDYSNYLLKINRIKAFTLVEMVVSITISLLLLWALSMFLGSGLESVTFQRKSIEWIKENTLIYENIFNIVSWASNYKFSTSSWFIVKINRKNDKWWFAYIWEKNYHKTYCQTGNLDTNHLIIKTFIPFEYPWADFLAWTSYKESNTKYIIFFAWKIIWLWTTWKFLGPTDYLQVWWQTYISDTLDHTIKDENWTVIIWKSWIFWNYFKQGISSTEVLLNNPTWLAFWEGKLFFSDTLNDRILYLDSWKIYSLLDESDWLNEPTGLYYDNSRKALFIANSWSWNILEYSSSWSSNKSLEFKGFADNVNKIEIEFLNSSGTWSFITLSWPTNTWSFVLTGQDEDFLSLTWSKLTYYLEEYNQSESSQTDCDSAPKYIMNSSNQIVKCTQTGTWIVWTPNPANLSWTIIKVSDITPDFPSDNYFVKVDMWGKTRYFPYFVKSDNDITTKDDNILREVASWLNYPTWIKVSWNNLIVVNSFLDRKQYKININSWVKTDNLNLTSFSNFKNLADNSVSDYISNYPIKKLDFDYDNSSKLLSIILKTYKYYSCIDSWKNIENTEILKKIIK
jgi:hypothetical protein